MADGSDSDDLLEFSLNKRKKMKLNSSKDVHLCSSNMDSEQKKKISEQTKRFEILKRKSSEIMLGSSLRRQRTEAKRSERLLKKALRDPHVKAALENTSCSNNVAVMEDERTSWEDVKPYLTVNDHLQGPVPHGDCGPKTELEYQIEECIEEGDFEKAELLSDTLANRQFAVKITHAFAAKKYKERQDQQEIERKRKQMTKIRWTFDGKEKWQMKGNM